MGFQRRAPRIPPIKAAGVHCRVKLPSFWSRSGWHRSYNPKVFNAPSDYVANDWSPSLNGHCVSFVQRPPLFACRFGKHQQKGRVHVHISMLGRAFAS
ncbi:hypothetical protein CA603_43445 [Paraburkholderia hospita]|nr:hypothetical protein CA603_43445 [Paraburkholderia hospita]